MDTKQKFKSKLIQPNDLENLINPGDRIFLSSGPVTPVFTINYILSSSHPNFTDLEIIQPAILKKISNDQHEKSKYRIKSFIVGESIGKSLEYNNVDLIPSSITELPYLFASGAVGVDVAIIQTSPPDKKGNVNLGLVSDISDIVIKKAKLVIAEINPNVPVTYGKTSVSINNFNHIIESTLPLIEFQYKPYDKILDQIGWNSASLIENGSTISLSAGKIFNAIAHNLIDKKNLNICAHIVSDWIIELIESGAVKKKLKGNLAPIAASSCVGSNKLYKYTDHNPLIKILPLLYSNYQTHIHKIKSLVSIITAKKVDITGDSIQIPSTETQVAGFDGKLNFSIAAAQSRNGKSIIAVPSIGKEGNSNIVISFNESHSHIRSTLGTTRYIVTEYGIANMFGKSIRERAVQLIDIAHPDHRNALLQEAREKGIIFKDQIYNIENSLNYPYELEEKHIFNKKIEILFRPIKISDEDTMRRLFYHFSDEAKYFRYFSKIKTMPHKKMQQYVNVDYKQTLSIVGIIIERGIEKIIAEARYSFSEIDDGYEIAFIVDEDYQGIGIGRFLFDKLYKIAEKNGIKKLYAIVLPENKRMAKVFTRYKTRPEISEYDDEIQFTFYTDENFAMYKDLR